MHREAKAKPVSARPRTGRRQAAGGTLLGMFIGLVLGVLIAAGVVWYMNKAPMPFVANKAQQAPAVAAHPDQPPAALPGKPGDPLPEKRFQFYDILPGKAEAVPDKPADGKTSEKAADKSPDKDKSEDKVAGKPHYLQAGAFSKAQDADNLKANLAMMGLEASVQQVMVQDKTFYRLRLGPYTRIEEANKVRSELAKAGIDTTLVGKE